MLRKMTLRVNKETLDEIRAVAKAYDCSISWIIRRAWAVAKGELHRQLNRSVSEDVV